MAQLNLAALRHIKATKWSSPGNLCDLGSDGIAPACAYERKGCNCCHDRWEAIVDQLIATFEALIEDEEDTSLLELGWEKWEPIYEARRAKIEEGLALYAKWFRAISN